MKNTIINKKSAYRYLTRLKRNSELTFSKHEIFGNLALSLDTIRKRLMISRIVNQIWHASHIQLSATRLISIKKVYKDINVGQLRHRKLDEFLQTIYLQFEFLDGRNTIHLPLFERGLHDPGDLPVIERKARYWQDLLSEIRLLKTGS